jgi:putative transposase
MARPLRLEFAGATHHVTSRGNERRNIFRNDVDRKTFLQFLGEATDRFGWSVTAWVLMSNHFHIVIQTPEANLSRGMHWLNGRYASWFNVRHRRCGHLFQGRFDSTLIDHENYFSEVQRYVVLNPVRAGLAARPEDYRWSSYRATLGMDAAPKWLAVEAALSPFAPDSVVARACYREFVLAKLGCEDNLWDQVIHGAFLGSEEWAKKMRAQVESKPRSTDHPREQRAVGRPKMHTVLAAVAEVAETTPERIQTERGTSVRALVAWLGWHEGLVTLRTIAASLRMRSEGHISNLVRRCERLFSSDPSLLQQADAAVALLRA